MPAQSELSLSGDNVFGHAKLPAPPPRFSRDKLGHSSESSTELPSPAWPEGQRTGETRKENMTKAEEFRLFAAVDTIPELNGAGIGYVGDGQCLVIRKSAHLSGMETYVVIEITELAAEEKPASKMPNKLQDSSLMKEFVVMGINCTGAVLAGIATAGETAAAPVTAGASLMLVYVTATATVAGSLQCGISIGRVVDSFIDPKLTTTLDSIEWCKTTADVLDWIGVVGAVASLGQAAQAVIRLQKTSGRSFQEILRGMNRAERKRLARDLADYAGTKSNREYKALVRAGKFPAIFSQTQVKLALKNQLLNSISAALGLSGSASTGVLRRGYLVYITQES
jgi:hypothetical protein